MALEKAKKKKNNKKLKKKKQKKKNTLQTSTSWKKGQEINIKKEEKLKAEK